MPNPPTPLSRSPLHRAALLIGVLVALAGSAAWGNDRPFQIARTAVMSDDDDQTWSIESWAQRLGSVRGLSFEPEYIFDNENSVQVELSRYTDRAGNQTGHAAEIEFKHLFRDIVRDGWGWGVSAALGAERTRADGSVRSFGLKLPVSIAFGSHGAMLHLNAGIDKASGSRRAWSASAAVERELFERTVGFAELAHAGDLKFAQIGARHWLRREKLAIDVALQQQRSDGRRAAGFIIGLGWYEL